MALQEGTSVGESIERARAVDPEQEAEGVTLRVELCVKCVDFFACRTKQRTSGVHC